MNGNHFQFFYIRFASTRKSDKLVGGAKSVTDDFVALYYGRISKEIPITHRDVYEKFAKLLADKNVSPYVLTKVLAKRHDKDLRTLKMSYVPSVSNPDKFHWRVAVNILGLEKAKLVAISFYPEAKQLGLIAKKAHVKDLALKDLPFFKNRIGEEFTLTIGIHEINLRTFSFRNCAVIDIGNWVVNLTPDKSINYSDYLSNNSIVMQEIKNEQLKFRLINLSTRNHSENSQILTGEFSKLGAVLDPILDSTYATKLSIAIPDPNIMNVILSETDQEYYDSKQFFLDHKLPFQHIRNLSDFSDPKKQWLRNMVLLEMVKKMKEESLYLKPDEFQNRDISGFIYLDDIVKKGILEGYAKFLNIAYIFADSRNFASERIFTYSKDEIPFFSTKRFLKINDTDTLARKVRSGMEVIGAHSLFDVMVTKQITIKNARQISDSLAKFGITLNKIYYVSNGALRFADNFNALSLVKDWEHAFMKLAENIAIVKLATRPFLLPQMFSTMIRVIYPENASVDEEDVSKVIWLTKKRLYRIYNLPNMTQLEPVVIRRKNMKFLVNGSSKFYWLRHMI